jgi:hypothetical protein
MTQHYRMTLNSAIADYQAGLISATTLVCYYFRIRLAPGWKVQIDWQKVCSELGISKASFYKALQRLKEKKLINFNVFRRVVASLNHSQQAEIDETDKAETLEDRSETVLDKIENSLDRSETSEDKTETTTSTKPLLNKDSSQQPNSSSSSFQSFLLSLSTGQRERFLEFGKKQALSLPKPPVLIESWISNNYQELAKQCPDVVCLQPEEAQVDWESHPKYREWMASWQKYPQPFVAMDAVDGVDENYQPKKWVFGTAADRNERKAFAAWAKSRQQRER